MKILARRSVDFVSTRQVSLADFKKAILELLVLTQERPVYAKEKPPKSRKKGAA